MGNTLCNEDTAQRGGSLTDPNYVPRDQDYEQCPPNDAKKSQAQAEKFFDAQPGNAYMIQGLRLGPANMNGKKEQEKTNTTWETGLIILEGEKVFF